MTQACQVMNCSILGQAISKPDSRRCFVSCGAASKTCGFNFLALALKWHSNCPEHGGTQQAVGGTWQVGPHLELPHVIYCLGMRQLFGTSRKVQTYSMLNEES